MARMELLSSGCPIEINMKSWMLGTEVRKPGGVREYFVSRQTKQEAIKVLKICIQEIDRLAGKSIILDEDSGDVITAYHKSR